MPLGVLNAIKMYLAVNESKSVKRNKLCGETIKMKGALRPKKRAKGSILQRCSSQLFAVKKWSNLQKGLIISEVFCYHPLVFVLKRNTSVGNSLLYIPWLCNVSWRDLFFLIKCSGISLYNSKHGKY